MSSQGLSSDDLREKFLSFFESKGHEILPSSSLIPENDPTVLFTTAGMQQFRRYYLFPDEAPATRIATCQKCVRTGDIDEVGDPTHLTFFEMLGNFTFGYPSQEGSYFKDEAIAWAWEFLTQELGIDKSRIYATYFTGENGVSTDQESLDILKKVDGLNDVRPQGFDDNFWSLGTEGSPGGPTVEFYVDDVEVWNLVFNEYVMKDGIYELSELKGVDTGMGLERLVAKMNDVESVYLTDLFELEHKKLHEFLSVESPIDERIVLDHIRAAVFMINDGVGSSNKGQGYILRRLIRRAVVKARNLKINKNFSRELADGVCETFPNYEFNQDKIKSELEKEESKFRATLDAAFLKLKISAGMKEGVREGSEIKWTEYKQTADNLFDLFQNDGMPLEVALEEAKNLKIPIIERAFESADLMRKIVYEFDERKKAHQDKSRTASVGMFKGGLADNKIETTRLHTAAHLLLAALRHELDPNIEQKGSNITEERLRFDFNYPEKLTEKQIKKIEDLVNLKIEESLPVTMQELSIEDAKKSGATGSFHDKYGDTVKIFNIGNLEEPFSREICGGPHVENTSELDHFRIVKEESSSSGVRRIKAILE